MKNSTIAPSLATLALVLAGSPWSAATPSPGPSTPAQRADFLSVMLETSPRLEGGEIAVSVSDHLAKLTGTVRSLDDADFAIAAALAADGIDGVINCLEVASEGSVSDEQLFVARQTLDRSELLESQHISVSAEDDRLILDGSVNDISQRAIARELLSRLEGVPQVENRLNVAFQAPRADTALQQHVRLLIADEPLFDMLPLNISVSSGEAVIEGSVGCQGDLDRLCRLIRIDGIGEVNDGGVQIDPHLRMEGMRDFDPSDREILLTFDSVIESDSRIGSKNVKAELDNGVLVITGEVGSREELQAVLADARGLPGIRDILNQLSINPGQALSFN